MDFLEHPVWPESALHKLMFQPQSEMWGSPIGSCPVGEQVCPKACFLYFLDKKDSLFPATGANSSCVTSYRHPLARSQTWSPSIRALAAFGLC